MAKAKRYKTGVNNIKPFKVVLENGDYQKKYTIELNVREISIISNALKYFENNKIFPSSMIRGSKKLSNFFENVLDE